MKRLYLSSFLIQSPKEFSELVGKPLDNISMSVITNSKDAYLDVREVKVQKYMNFLGRLGLQPVEVDLRNFSDPEVLERELTSRDVVWAVGGNTFMLRQAMRTSGFDQIINRLVDGGLVYGGDSAGALVAGRTLRGVELADDPSVVVEPIWEGLGLVDDFILPHVNSDNYAEATEKIRALYAGSPSYLELKDWEAYVYNGDTRTKVTSKNHSPEF
jgi:dipeptidase E